MSALPNRTTSEGLLLAHLATWRRSDIQSFMRGHEIPGVSNNKTELLEAVASALRDGQVSNEALATYLDELEPGNKQHVIVLKSNEAASEQWSTPEAVEAKLQAAGKHDLWDARVPLAAPVAMELSSVVMTNGLIDIYAVDQKVHLIRREDLDTETQRGSTPVVQHVYEKVNIRAWARLKWNTKSSTATLHISQLPSRTLYSEVKEAFWNLLGPFFPVDAFEELDLAHVISNLHQLEESSPPGEARAQAVGYLSHGGRRADFASSAGSQGLLHETQKMDQAMDVWRDASRGHSGNFYFLPGSATLGQGNPLTDEIHVYVVVKESRVNFPRPTDPADIDYVAGRIRSLA
jgi:hypothetical protein